MYRLNRLLDVGVDTLCISLDPFHIEYVPYEKPLRLASLCEREGMGYFLWQHRFLSAIGHLEPTKVHSRAELMKAISPEYLYDMSRSYGLNYGGRAVNIEMEYLPLRDANELLNNRPCRKLISGNHFHIDPQGQYIPPGCTGISIPVEEAISGLPEGRYPVFETLYGSGLAGLFAYAKDRGFSASEKGYSSACAFCFFIRSWLAKNSPSPELDIEHYEASMFGY